MPKRSGIFLPMLLVFSILFSAGAGIGLAGAASSLLIGPSGEVSIGAGESYELSLSVDSLPDGLSGYILTVELDNPDAAEIEAVSFPDWATLSDISELPASSVWLKAVDLQDAVGEGAEDVGLTTLTLRGLAGGSTGVIVTISRMDDDSENTIMLDGAEYSGDEEEEEEEEEEGSTGESSEESTEGSTKASDSGSQSGGGFTSVMQEETENITAEGMKMTDINLLENEAENSISENREASVNPGEEADESETQAGADTGSNGLPGFGFLYSASVFIILAAIINTNMSKIRRK